MQAIPKNIFRYINSSLNPVYKQFFGYETTGNVSHWINSVNSYLGVCKHYATYRFRKKLIDRFKDDPFVAFKKNVHCEDEK